MAEELLDHAVHGDFREALVLQVGGGASRIFSRPVFGGGKYYVLFILQEKQPACGKKFMTSVADSTLNFVTRERLLFSGFSWI